MRAGEKNRRIRIEVLSTSKSTFGSDTETWLLLREVWANVTYLSMKEQETHQGDQILSESFVQFKIDYIASLSPKNARIWWEGQLYDIWHITQIGYREAMLLKCRLTAVKGIGSQSGIAGSAQNG